MPTPSRQFAGDVVRELRERGYVALWAGGCVRDQLLGIEPKDYDVATSATPEEVRTVFGRRRTIPLGASFGVITVLGPKDAAPIEVATFRTDGGYSDGRHPDQIQFSTPQHDAQRRDFTINGLFYDPVADEVLDYVGGEVDIAAGIVRAIGNPRARIAEDKLRMLRAVRFAARFDFAIDADTRMAIRDHSAEISQVSGERIGAEMRAMLQHPHRAEALSLLRECELEPHVLPELTAGTADFWTHLRGVLGRLKSPTFPAALAAILSQFERHVSVASIRQRWKLANAESERVDWLVNHLPIVRNATNLPWPQLQRVLIHDGAEEIVKLAEASDGEYSPAVALCREKLALEADVLNPSPLITGEDLIATGLKPGPMFAELLEQVRDAQLLGHISSKDEALAMVRG
jgi:poly(A) polymerase